MTVSTKGSGNFFHFFFSRGGEGAGRPPVGGERETGETHARKVGETLWVSCSQVNVSYGQVTVTGDR